MESRINKNTSVVEPMRFSTGLMGAMGLSRYYATFSQNILDRYAIWEKYPWSDAVIRYLENEKQEEASQKKEQSSFFVILQLLKIYLTNEREKEKADGKTQEADSAELTLRMEAELRKLKTGYDKYFGILERLYREGTQMPREELSRIWKILEREAGMREAQLKYRETDVGPDKPGPAVNASVTSGYGGITPHALGRPGMRLRLMAEGHAHIPNGKALFQRSVEKQQREFYTQLVRSYVVWETVRQAEHRLGRELHPFEYQALQDYGDGLGRDALVFYVQRADARLYQKTADLVFGQLAGSAEEEHKEGSKGKVESADRKTEEGTERIETPERPEKPERKEKPERTERPERIIGTERPEKPERIQRPEWVERADPDVMEGIGILLSELPVWISRMAVRELLRDGVRDSEKKEGNPETGMGTDGFEEQQPADFQGYEENLVHRMEDRELVPMESRGVEPGKSRNLKSVEDRSSRTAEDRGLRSLEDKGAGLVEDRELRYTEGRRLTSGEDIDSNSEGIDERIFDRAFFDADRRRENLQLSEFWEQSSQEERKILLHRIPQVVRQTVSRWEEIGQGNGGPRQEEILKTIVERIEAVQSLEILQRIETVRMLSDQGIPREIGRILSELPAGVSETAVRELYRDNTGDNRVGNGTPETGNVRFQELPSAVFQGYKENLVHHMENQASVPVKGRGAEPGEDRGSGTGENRGSKPGENRGSESGENRGSKPGENRGSEPGENRGLEPEGDRGPRSGRDGNPRAEGKAGGTADSVSSYPDGRRANLQLTELWERSSQEEKKILLHRIPQIVRQATFLREETAKERMRKPGTEEAQTIPLRDRSFLTALTRFDPRIQESPPAMERREMGAGIFFRTDLETQMDRSGSQLQYSDRGENVIVYAEKASDSPDNRQRNEDMQVIQELESRISRQEYVIRQKQIEWEELKKKMEKQASRENASRKSGNRGITLQQDSNLSQNVLSQLKEQFRLERIRYGAD